MSLFCNHECLSDAALHARIKKEVDAKTEALQKEINALRKETDRLDPDTYYGERHALDKLIKNIEYRFSSPDSRPHWFIKALVEEINNVQLKESK